MIGGRLSNVRWIEGTHQVDGTSILIAFVSPKKKLEQKIYLSGCGLKPAAGVRYMIIKRL